MKRIVIALALSALSFPVFAGWYFESSTTGNSKQQEQGKSGMFTHKAKGWMDGDKMRTEISDSNNPMMPSGSFMISTNGGQTINIVNPAKRTITVINPQQMADMGMGMAGAMMKFTQPQFEVLVNEDAGEFLGQPVRHHKFRTAYTMEMNLFGMKNATQTETIQEMLVASGIKNPSSGFMSGQAAIKIGDAAFDKRVADEMAKVKGMPLKMTMTTRTTQDGKTEESVMNMEVTRLEEQRVPSSKFEIPADFTEISMFEAALGGMPADADEEAATDEAPPIDAKALQNMFKNFKLPGGN